MEAVLRPHCGATEIPRGALLGWSLLPAVWLLLFWGLVVRARIQVGEWPHPRSGNPFDHTFVFSSIKPQHFGIHHFLVCLATPVAAASIALGVLLLVIAISWRRIRPPIWVSMGFVLSSALAVATVGLDLGGFWTWFID